MFNKTIYMDNAAATRLDERVLEAMIPFFFENYSVATSEFGYSLGIEAKEALEKARSSIADFLGANSDELIFTSGSTESSNLAIKGVALALGSKLGKHIIISEIEDFPVLRSAKSLEKQGFEVSYLPVDEVGLINTDELENLIREDTILVSIQHGNQEIGTLQDIKKIGEICKARGVLFHTDATHTMTRVPIDVKEISVDLITISAHTIHGPKGIGGLYIRKGTSITKINDGGFQEFNYRGGLENIPGAVGFAKAIELVTPEENKQLKKMSRLLIDKIFKEIPDVTLNGHPQNRIPQNVNITFHYVEGESLTLHLDMNGFAVSTGSACFSRSLEASHVIRGIGGDHERAHGSIRFTLGRYNSIEDIEKMVEAITRVVKELRIISPLGKSNSVYDAKQ
ncbi:MAG: cysteine desulfurase [Clostridiales bacterium]|nr:cysteine desulfurase [Clostridiales bacterium]